MSGLLIRCSNSRNSVVRGLVQDAPPHTGPPSKGASRWSSGRVRRTRQLGLRTQVLPDALPQRLDRHFKADLASILETIGHGFCAGGDPHRHTFAGDAQSPCA